MWGAPPVFTEVYLPAAWTMCLITLGEAVPAPTSKLQTITGPGSSSSLKSLLHFEGSGTKANSPLYPQNWACWSFHWFPQAARGSSVGTVLRFPDTPRIGRNSRMTVWCGEFFELYPWSGFPRALGVCAGEVSQPSVMESPLSFTQNLQGRKAPTVLDLC